jgi:hypothetical protein
MSVQSVGLADSPVSTAASARLFLPGAQAFADSLNIGQIIQGRVLREYEGNRYLVAFGTDERVVDSSIPLTPGEILHGRVVGLGDRVELQRVFARDREAATQQVSASEARVGRTANDQGAMVDALFQRYQIPLSEDDRATLLRAIRNAGDGEAMSLAGAMLGKLGLPQTGVLLDALYRAQRVQTNAPPAVSDREPLPEVLAVPAQQVAEWQTSSIRSLAGLLGQIAELNSQSERSALPASSGQASASDGPLSSGGRGSPSGRARGKELSNGQPRDTAQSALAQRILNAQTGGVVSHRSGYLPLLVGGKLVEVSFALFEQQRPATPAGGLQHRQVAFSLRTERFGQVDVVARITGDHVRVQLLTGSDENASEASRYAGELTEALTGSGWNVDEIAYGLRAPTGQDATVRSVIEHVISLDSLNRLV